MPIWRTDGKFDHRKTFTPICQHNFHRKRNKYRPLKSLICLLNPHLISFGDRSSDHFDEIHPRWLATVILATRLCWWRFLFVTDIFNVDYINGLILSAADVHRLSPKSVNNICYQHWCSHVGLFQYSPEDVYKRLLKRKQAVFC